MSLTAFLASEGGTIAMVKILDLGMLWLAENPEAEADFQAGLSAYKAAKAEGRELTADEIQTIRDQRKQITGETS